MPDLLLSNSYFLDLDEHEKHIMKPYAPLGAMSLSSYLKQAGADVQLHDTTFSDLNAYRSLVERLKPRVVGISSNCISRQNACEMAGIAHRAGALVVAGGPDPVSYTDTYFAAGVDVIGVGEGEETMRELLELCSAHDDLSTLVSSDALADVAGLAYQREDGKTFFTPGRDKIKDLDTLPLPDRDAIDLEPYLRTWRQHHGYSSLSFITQRGCPYRCSWCSASVFGHTFRQRSPQNVVDEMLYLRERFNPDKFWVADDVLSINKKWVWQWVDEIARRDAATPFECLSRVDLVDDEMLRGLKAAGAFRIWFGAESGAQHVLDAMHKGTKVEEIRAACGWAKQAGIEVGLFIMLGYPTETRDDVLKTLTLLKDIDPEVFGIAVAFPMKGTDFYENIKPLVRPESTWTQTNENRLVFEGQYRPGFYWFAERLLHNEVAMHRLIAHGPMQPLELLRRAAKSAICRAGTKAYSYFPNVRFENMGRSGKERIPRLSYRMGRG
ncbi:MAG TPA: radical SAM protein [Blastocatellia bacterium]|nr:radical SAM protein [Blastocatellia bacterium]